MAAKAGIYQGEGNLQEAARLLSDINEKSPNPTTFLIKIGQLRLERNYGEAIRLLQARLAQFKYASEYDDYLELAFTQRLAGDTAGVKITAQQARNTFEQIHRDQPDNYGFAARLSQAYAVLGEKDLALQTAEQAVMILPSVKDAANGPDLEENLAFVETMVGENTRAIITLTQLLQTPYNSWFYMTPITPALLRLDPFWDALRGDPAFQKLCEEKQP
jgi:tetratricopeptide (TPR) repeat protein